MMRVIDYLPEIFDIVKKQLEDDERRWGDTWRNRTREGQEYRIFERFGDYWLNYSRLGKPIPWAKVIGLAVIALIRERYGDDIP